MLIMWYIQRKLSHTNLLYKHIKKNQKLFSYMNFYIYIIMYLIFKKSVNYLV